MGTLPRVHRTIANVTLRLAMFFARGALGILKTLKEANSHFDPDMTELRQHCDFESAFDCWGRLQRSPDSGQFPSHFVPNALYSAHL